MAIFQLRWDPNEQDDPGPCIQAVVMNTPEVIAAGRSAGLDYPKPIPLKALIDTGASVSVISKTFANTCRLVQTGEGSEIRTLGATYRCGEHAGSISFPGTNLRSFPTMRLVSADFIKERHHACLIGRDILRYWKITFDGPGKMVTIEDKDVTA